MLWVIVGTPVFTGADQRDRPAGRVGTLDGLRGFLALGVFFHHAALYQDFLLTGTWHLTESAVFNGLGPFGVMMFFMTTGYLFWSKLRQVDGRPNWLALYAGRLFRIAPVYLLAVGVMLALVFANTGLHLNDPAKVVAVAVFKWLALGVFITADVNGYGNTMVWLAGVTWSLRAEWLFYASLPVLAVLARRPGWARPVMLAALAAAMAASAVGGPYTFQSPGLLLPLFVVGMGCVELPGRAWMRGWAGGVVAVAAIAGAFFWPTPYACVPAALLGVAFLLVVKGCDVFGLLRTRAAVRLGDISYGIYMLQGLALAAMLRPAPLRAFALEGPLQYWLLEGAAAVLLVLMALAAHVWLERPGIALGRRVAAALQRRARAPAVV